MKNALTSSLLYFFFMSIFVVIGTIDKKAYLLVATFFIYCIIIQRFYKKSKMVSFEWKDASFSLVFTAICWLGYLLFHVNFNTDTFCTFLLINMIAIVNLGSLNRYQILF